MLEARAKQIIKVNGREFKDLNANGELDAYEDWRKPVDARVADLVAQMTLEEKAGLMLIDTVNAACDRGAERCVPAPAPRATSTPSRCTGSSSATW